MKAAVEIVVDEPIEGHFYWTLVKQDEHGRFCVVVDYARGPFPTRSMAANAGTAALRRWTGSPDTPGAYRTMQTDSSAGDGSATIQ